jgi:hypothetical protein
MGLTVLTKPERTAVYELAEREERLAPEHASTPMSREVEAEVARADRERLATIDRILEEFDRQPAAALEELYRYGDRVPGILISADRVEHAFPRMSERERRALLTGDVSLAHGRLIPEARGGVVGMNYASFRNAPRGVRGKDWDVVPSVFYRNTVRNEQLIAQAPAAAAGWLGTTPLDFNLQKRGLLHELWIELTGTMTITPGTGSFTQGWKWPYGALGNRISLQSSGESGVQYGSPIDFRNRTERLYRNPPTGTLAGAGAGTSQGLIANQSGAGVGTLQSGANAIKVMQSIPVAHDLRTGIGSIFRASDDLSLVLHIDPPSIAELIVLTGNATAVWTATNVVAQETYMRIVRDDNGMIVLPDITRVFMTTVEEIPFNANGQVATPIPRLPGTLLSMMHVLDQGNGTVVAPSALSQIRMVYGENQQPQTLLPDRLLDINRRNYDGLINGGNYYALDGEVDNPQRDVWIPRNFTEGQIQVDIPNTVTPAGTSKSHLFFESLVQANLT